MGPEGFRRVALGMAGAIESAHMGHPDFRVNDRIFATLHPDLASGMVQLTPEQQTELVHAHRASFAPENGAWGRGGSTRVRLDSVDENTLGEAMTLAWQNAVRKSAAKKRTAKKRTTMKRTTMKRSAKKRS